MLDPDDSSLIAMIESATFAGTERLFEQRNVDSAIVLAAHSTGGHHP